MQTAKISYMVDIFEPSGSVWEEFIGDLRWEPEIDLVMSTWDTGMGQVRVIVDMPVSLTWKEKHGKLNAMLAMLIDVESIENITEV